MADREKVIKTLEEKISISEAVGEAPMLVSIDVLRSILALLKEQEDKIRQLELALKIMKGDGIKVDTEGR